MTCCHNAGVSTGICLLVLCGVRCICRGRSCVHAPMTLLANLLSIPFEVSNFEMRDLFIDKRNAGTLSWHSTGRAHGESLHECRS